MDASRQPAFILGLSVIRFRQQACILGLSVTRFRQQTRPDPTLLLYPTILSHGQIQPCRSTSKSSLFANMNYRSGPNLVDHATGQPTYKHIHSEYNVTVEKRKFCIPNSRCYFAGHLPNVN
eukprot:scaffold965_cov158-Amphora_coffeaeformis.AAC.9